ncbi:MAG TPA: DUF4350 domain-containing protein [Mycobacteriales bacterium]|nr:DUF4350 domain-containing protein [Mycobacteriales bacterium]
MTSAATGGAAGGSARTVVGPSARQVGRTLWLPLLLAGVVLLGALLIGLARTHAARGELDPDAVDRAGSRALRVLLADRGVRVHRATTVDDAVRQAAGGAAVLVPFPARVPAGGLRRLGDAATARLVLVRPDAIALRELTGELLPVGGLPVGPRLPGCADPVALAAGDADLGGRTYGGPGAQRRCYDGSLVFGRTRDGGPLAVVGTGAPFRNDTLAGRGNAALALGLLGGDGSVRDLCWLIPGPGAAAGGGDAGLVDLVPPWVPAAALQLLAGGLLVVLWRSRRLGPPVGEPLPVVVRAAETVEGRARLYLRGQARDRAADALRSGALARIVPRLRMGGSPPAEGVVAAVAARTGRPPVEVRALLYGAPPADDVQLVALADALDAVEHAVLR